MKTCCCCCCSLLLVAVVAYKRAVCFFRLYHQIFLTRSSFKQMIFAFLEQLNSSRHGIFIPTHSCLQCHWWTITPTLISQPQERKYCSGAYSSLFTQMPGSCYSFPGTIRLQNETNFKVVTITAFQNADEMPF